MDENSKNTNEDASNDAFCSSAETSNASSMSDSSQSCRKKRKGKKRGDDWKHFQILTENEAKCNHCDAVLQRISFINIDSKKKRHTSI